MLTPCELNGTNRIKIGMSAKNDFFRVKSYHKGSIYHCILECNNAKEVETILIKEFKKKYKLVCGNEYFHCDNTDEALELFLDIFLKNRKKTNINSPEQEVVADTRLASRQKLGELKEEKGYISEMLEEITDGVKNISLDWMSKFSYKS